MKSCGCSWCNDLRNVQPAYYISCISDKAVENFLIEAHKNKQFIFITEDDKNIQFQIIRECPVCGYKFSDEDYDSYLD